MKMRHAPETAARAYYKIGTDTNLNNKDDNENEQDDQYYKSYSDFLTNNIIDKK